MKTNLKKWMTLIPAAALSLSLAACAAPGQSAASPSDTGGASAVSPQEPASAVGTVGLSLGLTPGLGLLSQGILIALMFIGRVGGLTLIYAALSGFSKAGSRLPQERITVG